MFSKYDFVNAINFISDLDDKYNLISVSKKQKHFMMLL